MTDEQQPRRVGGPASGIPARGYSRRTFVERNDAAVTHGAYSIVGINEEAGQVWMARVAATYPSCVWLNPVPESEWQTTASIRLMRQILGGRMYPFTIEGLDAAMRELGR